MNNVFFTTTVHLSSWPFERAKNDPVSLHEQDDAIENMHRFCHEIYKVPITWIVSWGALKKYKEKLKDFCQLHGDEVGIMEYGIYPNDMLDDVARFDQDWVEEMGIVRSGVFVPSEPELEGKFEAWNDMAYEKQRDCISHLKKRYEDELGMPVTTFASPFINNDTIRVFKEVGITCSWAYNWNYFCEGINNKGCLPSPFYPSEINHNVPEKNKEQLKVLAVHWGISSFTTTVNAENRSRQSAAWCLNPMEFANRSLGLDMYEYGKEQIRERISMAKYNPYVHLPIQLEAVWMDEEAPKTQGYYELYPAFNPRCAEVFYSEIEECLRNGAVGITHSAFAQWHKENIGDTPETVFYSEDHNPELIGFGKDMGYAPFVVYGNKNNQYWFSKAHGLNYIRKYDYNLPVVDRHGELPFENQPNVFLHTKHQNAVYSGIHIENGKAHYEISGLNFTSYENTKEYAAAIWSMNMPEYITEQDILTENIKHFKLLCDKNTALIFADLKEGDNFLKFTSSIPEKYITVKYSEKRGRRYEIWIQNDNIEVELCKLSITIDKNLRLGGFWWDGFYHRSTHTFDYSHYNRDTGEFYIGAAYPCSFKLNTGLTRLSLELL